MENLEEEKMYVNWTFSANMFWTTNGRAALSATFNIKEIKESKLEPP
jgi:hypothetical protein